LPALDRCSVVLTSLQGLAQYHEHSPVFDVPASSFSLILDIIRCIRLLAHHIRVYASEEQLRFHAFSKWLRYAIEVQAADPTTSNGEEIIDKDPGVDFGLVFAYIQGAMKTSKIDQFLLLSGEPPQVVASPGMYDQLRQSLQQCKAGETPKTDNLKLWSYHDEWCKQNEQLLHHITNWQRANTFIPGGIVLSNQAVSSSAIRTVYREEDADTLTSYTALVQGTEKSERKPTEDRVFHSSSS
jgi:anaphase-promoting complex subunit 4